MITKEKVVENLTSVIIKYNIPVNQIIISDSFVGQDLISLLRNLNISNANLALVSDKNTFNIIGKEIISSLKENGYSITSIVLEKGVQPTIINAQEIADRSRECSMLIALGSGTIGDLCKYASFNSGKRYIMIPTAPSMNGYLSVSSSIINSNNLKQSYKTAVPIAVYIVMDILEQCPFRLIASGVADSLCKTTSKIDWYLASKILQHNFIEECFTITDKQEQYLLTNYRLLIARNKEAVLVLMEFLLLGGIVMTVAGGSYPASQGEHIIAHYLALFYPKKMKKYYHGEHIAVTTITMLNIQNFILQLKNLKLANTVFNYENIKHFFGNKLDANEINKLQNKQITGDKLHDINLNLETSWPHIKHKMINFASSNSVAKHKSRLLKIYKALSLPTTFLDLELTHTEYISAINNAYLLRDRFTFLDIWGSYHKIGK